MTFGAFVPGTPDPPAFAGFCRALLGRQEEDREPQWVRPGARSSTGRVSVSRWRTAMRLSHGRVDDLETEAARACALGATVEEHRSCAGLDGRSAERRADGLS
ncbi:VOC family protein [Streptomyces cremeus]|uniref:VOC family protein n=1 Tax=Streptomyces cremeus TaxID=66881 RepID=A0ABV5PJW0_STRCM